MHILSFCKVALAQGRYSWRHDSVLSNIEPVLRAYINRQNDKKLDSTPVRLIKFVKAGERAPKQKSHVRKHLLSDANDWKLQVDYKGKECPFPPNICTTSLRPDIVIWSESKKKIIILELTCPSEENIQQAIARKNERYVGLLNELKELGWDTNFFTIEAGVRGCLSKSFRTSLRKLGLTNAKVREICSMVSKAVSRCSYIIFQAHASPTWTSPSYLKVS